MPTLYTNESSDPKTNAQRNLMGRTHFVDPDTLRFHKSRVVSARDTCNGLLFYVIHSDALDFENSKRGFRYTIFDLFGKVVASVKLEDAFRTKQQATTAMYKAIDAMDPKAITEEGIARAHKNIVDDMNALRAKIAAID